MKKILGQLSSEEKAKQSSVIQEKVSEMLISILIRSLNLETRSLICDESRTLKVLENFKNFQFERETSSLKFFSSERS